MQLLSWSLTILLMLVLVSCNNDEDVTFQSENCAFATDSTGQTYRLCCRVTCTAEFDYDDYREQCTEVTTCTTATGEPCPTSVALLLRAPLCLY